MSRWVGLDGEDERRRGDPSARRCCGSPRGPPRPARARQVEVEQDEVRGSSPPTRGGRAAGRRWRRHRPRSRFSRLASLASRSSSTAADGRRGGCPPRGGWSSSGRRSSAGEPYRRAPDEPAAALSGRGGRSAPAQPPLGGVEAHRGRPRRCGSATSGARAARSRRPRASSRAASSGAPAGAAAAEPRERRGPLGGRERRARCARAGPTTRRRASRSAAGLRRAGTLRRLRYQPPAVAAATLPPDTVSPCALPTPATTVVVQSITEVGLTTWRCRPSSLGVEAEGQADELGKVQHRHVELAPDRPLRPAAAGGRGSGGTAGTA